MKRSYLALDLGAESGRAMVAHLAGGKVELAELHRFAKHSRALAHRSLLGYLALVSRDL